jgi:hypothetical protein
MDEGQEAMLGLAFGIAQQGGHGTVLLQIRPPGQF